MKLLSPLVGREEGSSKSGALTGTRSVPDACRAGVSKAFEQMSAVPPEFLKNKSLLATVPSSPEARHAGSAHATTKTTGKKGIVRLEYATDCTDDFTPQRL
jgi:hypothetical protein